MKKLPLDELFDPGDFIQVVDPSDSDFGEFFVYRGRKSGYNVLDWVGGVERPVAVEHLPESKKLFALKVSVPEPGQAYTGEQYALVLRDLAQNSGRIEEALALQLKVSYDNYPRYETGELPYSYALETIVQSGLKFSEYTPGFILAEANYFIAKSGIAIQVGNIPLSKLDELFSLGLADKWEKACREKLSDEELNQPAFDREKMKNVYEQLVDEGVMIPELMDMPPYKLNDFDLGGALRYSMGVRLVEPNSKGTLFFSSLKDAKSYVNETEKRVFH